MIVIWSDTFEIFFHIIEEYPSNTTTTPTTTTTTN